MKDRFHFNETVTSYFEMETIIRSKITDAISLEQTLEVLKMIKEMDLQGMDIVEDESEKFFKQQNLTKAINAAQDIIKRGDFDKYYTIEDTIKKALEVNTKVEYGCGVFDELDEVLSDSARIAIPTGADKLDDALYGGLGKGELGVIIAPAGLGKTSATTGFAASAATYKCEENNYQGYKVLHYFFEDTLTAIKRKYIGYVTDYDACEIGDETKALVVESLKENREICQLLKNNVVMDRLRTGETKASDIKRKIQQQIARGFKPDLVVIDYFECLQYESEKSSDSEWTKEAVTMRKLEAMADEFNIAIWVPIQGTKDSIGAEIVGMMQGGGSVKKIQIAHVVITLAQTDAMKVLHKLNMFLGKFRGGRMDKNKFLNVSFNNGTCKFDMTEDADAIDAPMRSQSMEVAQQTYLEQKKRGTK